MVVFDVVESGQNEVEEWLFLFGLAEIGESSVAEYADLSDPG